MISLDQPKSSNEIAEQRDKEIIYWATEMIRRQEILPFKGIDPEIYSNLKAADEEYPGMSTPIDEIINRCTSEGIKVVFGRDPDSGNVYILPAQSTDILNDGIQPQSLKITDQMNEGLKRLITLDRERIDAQKASKLK
jgi:hypothetical protein